MRTNRKPKGGFARFMRQLDGKELNNDTTDLLLAKKRIGRELYSRYEKLLEWIAGECDWRSYTSWVWEDRSGTERQACRTLRWDVLGIGNHTVDSLGMYNGDRSSTLDKAVEYILSNLQSQQQDDVSPRVAATRQYPSAAHLNTFRWYYFNDL